MEKSKSLRPKEVFDQFAVINGIPRPSKREERMIAYLKDWGESRGLETKVDEAGNVRISKKATPGYEGSRGIILQSHMDMVCDKLVDVEFDFDKDAIQTYIDGDWMGAKGTTLGADDGIGVAMELAILDSNEIEHGPIQCVFTRDEETGLTGANALKPGFMTGDWLINLDSEDEGQIFVSCAGGRNSNIKFHFLRESAPTDYFFAEGWLKGLKGGHSGDDIEKKRANAIKLLGRFLYLEMCKTDLRISRIDSGKMHNAIPRDGRFRIAVPWSFKEQLKADWNVFSHQVSEEYHVSEGSMEFGMESAEGESVIPKELSDRLIRALQAVDNGVFAICQEEELGGMVETSSNIASIETGEDVIRIVASQRSNVMSQLDNQCNTIKALFELAGAEVEQSDGYPAWKMNSDSELTKLVVDTYRQLFGKDPIVRGIHAGLECGLFSERYPELDMVSLGPTLRNVHTPDEKIYIPSVEMVWNHLLLILKSV